jgi:hypothetical protein
VQVARWFGWNSEPGKSAYIDDFYGLTYYGWNTFDAAEIFHKALIFLYSMMIIKTTSIIFGAYVVWVHPIGKLLAAENGSRTIYLKARKCDSFYATKCTGIDQSFYRLIFLDRLFILFHLLTMKWRI